MLPRNGKGETMIMQAMPGRYRRYARKGVVQDIVMVLSFGLWAMLLGFVPAMAIRVFAGS
jgi:hypothetical protein